MPATLSDHRDELAGSPLRPRDIRTPRDAGRQQPPTAATERHNVTSERVMLAVLYADVSDSTRLYERGAILAPTGRKLINPAIFDQLVLEIGSEKVLGRLG